MIQHNTPTLHMQPPSIEHSRKAWRNSLAVFSTNSAMPWTEIFCLKNQPRWSTLDCNSALFLTNTFWLFGRKDEKVESILVTTGQEFIPIAAQRGSQAAERWQAGKIVSRLDVLNVADAHSHLFGQALLGQIAARSQGGDVPSESLSTRTRFGFARRHIQIFAKMLPAKHEALLRGVPCIRIS